LAYSQVSLDAFFSGQILIKLEVTKNQILLKKIQHQMEIIIQKELKLKLTLLTLLEVINTIAKNSEKNFSKAWGGKNDQI